MLTFIKKDLLVFWRDRREASLAIILPIVLVVVLNFAFANMFGTDERPVSLSLAIINEDDEAAGLQQFEEKVRGQGWGVADTEAVVIQAQSMAPISLMDQYFQSPELADWLVVKHLSEVEALNAVEQEEVDAALRIPAGYTFGMLNAIMFGEDGAVPVPYIVKDNTLSAMILGDVIQEFFDHINFQLALQHLAGDSVAQHEALQFEGGRETIEGSEPFTMGQYFTIAMAVLFALFLASSIAGQTSAEKREQVFNRIVITTTRPHVYLVGKMCSTFLLVLLQFMFIVLISEALLGVFSGKSSVFWLGLFFVAVFYALFVAGLSALYTSLMLKMNSIDAANGLFLLITMVFGTVGGSFVPMYVFPEWLRNVGEWTPNGLTLAVLTEWVQFEQFSELGTLFVILGLAFVVCLFAGISLFPKRGGI